MPKYCSVPNCRNESGSSDRKSFYKFPFQDPVRLQQWLRNMGRENWTPSRHQYICQEHFTPSCFKVRWGIRYLENNAVPTVFQESEKRKAADLSEKKPKRHRDHRNHSVSVSDDTLVTFSTIKMQSALPTAQLYEFTVDPLQPGEPSLMETRDIGEPDCSLQTDLDSQGSVDTAVNIPLTLYQTEGGVTDMESTEVVVMSDCPVGETQDELMNRITAAILNQSGTLILSESGSTEEPETSYQVQDVHEGQEVIAYFETIPSVLPSKPSIPVFSPDTVLSSALSAKPIPSTLPIVSKHISPSSLVLSLERLDTEEGEGGGGMSEEEDTEPEGQQLEEHRYHKNSLSKDQLEAIVTELQKKVKVLQQRHRRHLEKLVGLESSVSQLRQSNLLNEERLKLLERAYLQTSAAVADVGETVAIIYENDNTAYFYTPPIDAGTALNVDEN